MDYTIVPVTAYQQNACVLMDPATGEGAVTDPGGDIDKLERAIDEMGVKVTKILLTHGHLDHCGAAGVCRERWQVPIIGPHREDNFWIQGLPMQSQMMGLPAMEPFEPDQWLNDGETVPVGSIPLDVLYCPGHTPGHVVFVDQKARLAWVGDVLFQGSIGRTDFPRGDYATLMGSICEKLLPLGDDIRFVPGHGPESTFGRERKTNPFVTEFLNT